MQPGLRCPATRLDGRLLEARTDVLEFTAILSARYVVGAPPGCSELRRGRVARDSSVVLVLVEAGTAQVPVGRTLGAVAGLFVLLLLFTSLSNLHPS